MEYAREIEKKFILNNISFNEASYRLRVLGAVIEEGASKDYFWEAPGVDFIRLRHNTFELTIKKTDKVDITDRIEENLTVGSIPVATRFIHLLFGSPSLVIQKEFLVVRYAECMLSLYTVSGDQKERLFFEVEANDIGTVDKVSSSLFPNKTLETRSLYQIMKEAFNG